MQRKRLDLNAVYISERVQKCLHAIADSALTAVVAPMGYGKTTAVNWFLAEQSRVENALVVRVSIYSENLQVFWKSLQNAFAAAGLTVLDGCDCPQDASGAAMLLDDLCAALQGGRACYLFLDDFHLLQDDRAADFLCALAGRLPDNAHLIVASRNRFVPGREVVRLGRRLHRVETDQLRLNRAELTGYARRCGLELTGEQADALLRSSEGWFSAVYLNFHALAERGALLGGSSDIYAMFTSAMIECLPEQRQEFLAVMGLADEFTVEMARAVTGMPDADQVLKALTEQNAFVTRLPGGEQFRFHHMMKECAEKLFARMPEQRRNTCWKRYGDWYAAEQRYLQALNAYEACGDHDAALAVVEQDAGILLASLKPADLLARLERCPVPVLKQHPAAILVLMRCMFNLRQIPKMLELKELLLASAAEHPEWPEEEKGNLLGECDLILSFLMYNDISAMSRLHRSASTQMSRPAISIQNSGGWTFGSPSVLMMFHRQPGQQALAQAAPDGFAMPFAENYRYLAGLLEAERSGGQAELAGHICALGRAQEKRCAALNRSEALPEAAAALTDRELRMAGMIARRCTNREIAQAMFLSEGTVKQYINQLYARLDIGGDVRTRRARLAELFRTKN